MFSSLFNQTEKVDYGKLKSIVSIVLKLFASLDKWLARFNQFYKASDSTQASVV